MIEKEKKPCEDKFSSSQKLADARKTAKKQRKAARKRVSGKAAPRTAAERRAMDEGVMIRDEDGISRRVGRYVDTIEALFRRGRIDARQRQAACEYRDLAEKAAGSIPCALDMSRVRGAAGPCNPTDGQLIAAERLAQASAFLGNMDNRLVAGVAVHGFGIEQMAGMVFGLGGRQPAEGDVRHVGQRLRLALAALADFWWPVRPQKIRGVQSFDPLADMLPASGGTIERGRTVHATGRRIYEK